MNKNLINKTNLSSEEMINLYTNMSRIRKVEEQLGEDFKKGKLPGAVHLYIGQEAIATGICSHLNDEDWITSTHRGHGHFLAKGGDTKLLMAEVYGREGGICKGLGGSMHVADFSKGIIGANGIVGAGLSIATGAALAAQMEDNKNVGVVFFGDGAANQGVLCEALNISSLWKLPLILVCENNGFSEFSPTKTVTSGEIVDRAKPFEVKGEVVDGNDVIDVWQIAGNAIERARNGEGPTLIEARTYRQRGHVEAEVTFLTEKYREQEDVDEWINKDPITILEKRLVSEKVLDQSDLDKIDKKLTSEISSAINFAESSPWPDITDTSKFMFE